jgi:ribosomal protein S18 acetylase RimI-like enzyme
LAGAWRKGMVRLPLDEVLIRPATAEDAQAVARMWERLVTFHRALDDDLPSATHDGAQRYAKSLAERVEDSHTCTYVAEGEGQLIGYVLGVVVDFPPEMFEQEPSGFLADIYVEEGFRGQGVGRALVQALVEWFRTKGLDYFEWHVAARNADGVKFWRAMGGREVMLRMRSDIPIGDDDDGTALSHGQLH